MLGSVVKTGTHLPDVCEGLGVKSRAKVQDFNAQNIAYTLWVVTKTSTLRRRSPWVDFAILIRAIAPSRTTGPRRRSQ